MPPSTVFFFAAWRTKALTDSSCSKKTVYAFFALQKWLRFLLETVSFSGNIVKVQIDEFLHKHKNHVGRDNDNKPWVFGMIKGCLESHKIVLWNLKDRSASSLLPIVGITRVRSGDRI